MGLYAHIDLSEYIDQGEELIDLGNSILIDKYEYDLEDLDSGTGQDEAGVQWDDMEELEYNEWDANLDEITNAFKVAFMDTINELTPVRTGYLISSISCDISGGEIDCYAEAEYAQYVEYGTSRMSAQPYFEPAIRAGIEAARMQAETINNNMADDIEQAWLEIAEAACDSVGPGIAAIMLALVLIIILTSIIAALCDLIKNALNQIIYDALDEALDIMII